MYNKAKHTHTLFKLHEKQTKKKETDDLENGMWRMWDEAKQEKNHWLIISKLYFYTKKSQSKKSEKEKLTKNSI